MCNLSTGNKKSDTRDRRRKSYLENRKTSKIIPTEVIPKYRI